MSKRLVRVLFVLIALASGCVVIWFVLPDPPGVSLANYGRISEGQSQQEVELLLGGPPSDFSPGGVDWSMLHNGLIPSGHTSRARCSFFLSRYNVKA